MVVIGVLTSLTHSQIKKYPKIGGTLEGSYLTDGLEFINVGESWDLYNRISTAMEDGWEVAGVSPTSNYW